jgi:RimJ/RimL family protein N-acetyltransferase
MNLSNFRVYLRALAHEDLETIYSWHIDDEIVKDVVSRKYFVSQEYEKNWLHDAIITAENSLKLAVCITKNKQHIGNVYLNNIDYFNKNANSGLLLGDKSLWGQGFGTEGYLLLLHHAFYDLGLIRVSARQLLHNKASIRLHEKSGFKNEGILRKAIFKDGEYRDLNLMSVLREDFDQITKQLGQEKF